MGKSLFDRIKYINRPQYGLKCETDLFKKACKWITQNPPENSSFQVNLVFNNMGLACDAMVEVFQNDVSLGTYSVLETQNVNDVVTFT